MRFRRADESEERQEKQGYTGGALSIIFDWSDHGAMRKHSIKRHEMAHRRCVLREMHAIEHAETVLEPKQAHGVQYDLEDRQRDRDRSDRSTDE